MIKNPYILTLSKTSIKKTAELLKSNQIVIFPTDTVYGILANALEKTAIEKVIAFKGRDPNKPISVFVKDLDTISPYVEIDKRQKEILNKLLPGPYTIILKLSSKGKETFIPPIKTDQDTIGIRIINYQPIKDILELVNFPLTATSANQSSKGPYIKLKDLIEETPMENLKHAALFVKLDKTTKNTPSTVIDLTEKPFKILRRGQGVQKAIKLLKSLTNKMSDNIL